MNQINTTKFLQKSLISFPLAKAIWRAKELEIMSQISLHDPILDIGCGNGIFCRILFQGKNKKIVGLDKSQFQLKKARRQKIYQKVVKGDVCELNFKSQTFKTVIANCTLEHIKEIDKALQQISKVLTRGGKFIFSIPSDHFNQNLLGNRFFGKMYIKIINNIYHHHHLYSPDFWQNKLYKYRLKLIKYHYYIPKNLQHLWEVSLIFSILPHLLGQIFFHWPYPIQKLFSNQLINLIAKYNRKKTKSGGGLILIAKKV